MNVLRELPYQYIFRVLACGIHCSLVFCNHVVELLFSRLLQVISELARQIVDTKLQRVPIRIMAVDFTEFHLHDKSFLVLLVPVVVFNKLLQLVHDEQSSIT